MPSRMSQIKPAPHSDPNPPPSSPVPCALRLLRDLLLLTWVWLALPCAAGERELVRDPHFQNGFYLLEPKPGKRVVYSELTGWARGEPAWDLAQWSSRFPLRPGNCSTSAQSLTCSNTAKSIVVGLLGSPGADLSLALNAGAEYPRPRKSANEPWVHLLVQQDFPNPPTLGELAACNFRRVRGGSPNPKPQPQRSHS
jgi:hypothetical protein